MQGQTSSRWSVGRSAAIAVLPIVLLLAQFAGAAAPAPARSRGGMVASPQADATRAGVEMLEAGGNAVDAAVATAFALSVTDAHHSGVGGGGFLLIRMADGRAIALDARETAPAAASADMYLAEGLPEHASRIGGLAVATPGLVRGLTEALAEYGTLSLEQVMAPAIRLAELGFAVGPRHTGSIAFWQKLGLAEHFPETARIQLPADGSPLEPGFRLVQTDMAKTLRAISVRGADAFYSGEIAEAIVAAVRAYGGILTLDDLAGYATRKREPIRGTYRGHEVISFPPPSSGGIALVEILNVVEPYDLAALGAGSSASLHRLAEAMKLAFADRNTFIGDADFVDVPVDWLISREHADALRARINPAWWRRAPWTWGRPEVAIHVEAPGEAPAGGGTTHLSVTDAAGNAVSITQTINLILGSGITVPGTGILLNDEMDDFSIAPGTPNAFGLIDTTGANAIAPGKRPLSSMTPTLLVKDGKIRMVTGSPGGPRIITTTLQSIVNVVDYGMDVQEALAFPRFHHQWVPDRLLVEDATPADVVDALRARGHHVEISERNWSSAQAIVVEPDGLHMGASDPRGDGIAQGP
ncbi:MAG: gamma-glutamyltransferase [bacterium]|nr:gamma-glutamyltransferase [bacterium]MCP5066934.1 gamma-glutamyltransferase [bacterium]